MAVAAEAAGVAPYVPLDFEDLFCFWRALGVWIVDLVHAVLVALENLLHLLFGDEAPVVPEPVVGQVLAAVIAHMLLFVGTLNFLVPELEDLVPTLLLRQSRAAHRDV